MITVIYRFMHGLLTSEIYLGV